MLLRHYLEHGTSKSALARQLGISRDTVHRWIRVVKTEGDDVGLVDDEPPLTPFDYARTVTVADGELFMRRRSPSDRRCSRPTRCHDHCRSLHLPQARKLLLESAVAAPG